MSDDPLPPESRQLLQRLVNSYTHYVRGRLGDSAMVESMDAALEQGREWLAGALEELLSLPFREQRRGPLEIFQEAMRFPTACLQRADVEPAQRDPVKSSALPGDIYDLAPASSRDLGEEVWVVHLAWGAAKARAIMSPPRPEPDGDGR